MFRREYDLIIDVLREQKLENAHMTKNKFSNKYVND